MKICHFIWNYDLSIFHPHGKVLDPATKSTKFAPFSWIRLNSSIFLTVRGRVYLLKICVWYRYLEVFWRIYFDRLCCRPSLKSINTAYRLFYFFQPLSLCWFEEEKYGRMYKSQGLFDVTSFNIVLWSIWLCRGVPSLCDPFLHVHVENHKVGTLMIFHLDTKIRRWHITRVWSIIHTKK